MVTVARPWVPSFYLPSVGFFLDSLLLFFLTVSYLNLTGPSCLFADLDVVAHCLTQAIHFVTCSLCLYLLHLLSL